MCFRGEPGLFSLKLLDLLCHHGNPKRIRCGVFGVSDVRVGLQVAGWVMNDIRRPLTRTVVAEREQLARVLLHFWPNFLNYSNVIN